MKYLITASLIFAFMLTWSLPAFSQSRISRKPALIRDTDVAEGKDNTDEVTAKEPNPLLAEQNLNIGNFYFKKRNYDAAIQRYLEAIEYQANYVQAYEALGRAYEKIGDKVNAIKTYKDFIEKNPDAPQCPDFRIRVEKLAKK